jgi:hypothetical protein
VNNAIEVGLFENEFECGAVANVNLVDAVARIFQVLTDVFPFDRRVVKVVEIVNHGNACDVGGEQAVNEMGTDKAGAASDEKVLHHSFVA